MSKTQFPEPIGEVFYSSDLIQALENNAVGQPVYLGMSAPGTSKAADKWQIKKFTYDNNGFVTDVQFAGGTSEFVWIWDNRASYTYL